MLKRAKVEFIWDDASLWQTRRQFMVDVFSVVAKNFNAVPRLIDSDFVNEEEDSLIEKTIYFEQKPEFPQNDNAPKLPSVKQQLAKVKIGRNQQGQYVK